MSSWEDLFWQPYPSRWYTELLATCQLETEKRGNSLTHSRFFLEWRRKSIDYPWEPCFYSMWYSHYHQDEFLSRIKNAQLSTEVCVRTWCLNGPTEYPHLQSGVVDLPCSSHHSKAQPSVHWICDVVGWVYELRVFLKTQSSPRSKHDKPRGPQGVPAMLSNPDLPRSTAIGELPTTCCLNKTLMSVGPRESILHCLELRTGRHD